MNSKRIVTGLYGTNCYIVESSFNGKSYLMIIDPGDSPDFIIDSLAGKQPSYIVLTHAHFDHIGALNRLKEEYPEAKFCVGASEKTDSDTICKIAKQAMGPYFNRSIFNNPSFGLPQPDILLNDGGFLEDFEVLFTPGHTNGSICLYNKTEKVLFSGDTIFRHGYGRTDLDGNSELIFKSIKKIMTLEDSTVVYPGHGDSTTIAEEKTYYLFSD